MGSALGSCFKSTGKYNIINGVHGNGHIKQSPPPEAATGGGEDPSEKGAQLEDRLYNNTAFEQPDVDPNDPQQQDAALKIQTKYRQHHSVQVVQDKREDQAATKIQAGFRGFQGRQKVKNIKTESDQASQQAAEEAEHDDLQADEEVAAVTKDEQEVDIDLNDPEVAAAATKIQASFKGFKARQEVQEMKKNAAEGEAAPEASAEEDGVATETKTEDEEVDIDLNDPEVAAAATKIQAGFKGYKARKDVEALKEGNKTTVTMHQADKVDIDLSDPEVEKAATKIQAGFKGFKSRQELKAKKEENQSSKSIPDEESLQKEEEKKREREGEIDIDLNDPEVEKAATKIQASFKGMKARRNINANRDVEESSMLLTGPEQGSSKPPTLVKDGGASTKNPPQQEEEEVDIDLEDPEVEKAAFKIQAQFKGLKARRSKGMPAKIADTKAAESPAKLDKEEKKAPSPPPPVKEEEKKPEEEEIDIDLDDPEVEKAATKIQAQFKNFKSRKSKLQAPPKNEARREDSGDANAAGETELVQSEAADSENKEADETQNEAEQAQNEAQPEATAEPGEEKQKGDDVNQDEEKDTKEKAEESAQDASEIDFETAEVAQAKVDTEGKQDDDDKDRSETPASMGSDGQTAEATPGDAAVGDVTDDAAVTQQQEQTTSEAGEKNMEETPEKTGDASPLVVEEQHVDQPGPSPDHSTAADEQKDGDVKDDDVIATTDGSPAEATKQAEEEIEDDGGKPLDLKTDETEDSPPPKDATASDANGGETLEKEPQQQDQQQESKSGTAASPDKAPEASDEEETTVESTEEPKAEENKVEAEAEVDIDLKDPEVEKAATKIQAGFKGMKARKEVRERKGEGQHEEDEGPKEAVEEKKDDEKEDVDIDLKDPEVEKAATKIQAGFKGMKARKEVKSMRTEDGATEDSQEKPEAEEEAEKQADKPEEIDIDLNDPQVNAAATKIQATFKGHKTRKDMKGKKGDGEAAADGDAVNNEEGDGKGNNDTPAE